MNIQKIQNSATFFTDFNSAADRGGITGRIMRLMMLPPDAPSGAIGPCIKAVVQSRPATLILMRNQRCRFISYALVNMALLSYNSHRKQRKAPGDDGRRKAL